MTDFSDFKTTIAEWANRQDWSDALVTSFVRSAEEKFNQELRIDRMIKTVVNTVDHECAPLPDDWLESDFTKMAANTPTGWFPIRYMPRDKFFSLPNTWHSGATPFRHATTYGSYTIEGRTIFFGGPADAVNGVSFEMDYYAEVPVFADDQDSWVYDKFPSLYRYAALMHADLHAVGEEQASANMKQLAEDMIMKLNADHMRARASGSRLARGHTRSFG